MRLIAIFLVILLWPYTGFSADPTLSGLDRTFAKVSDLLESSKISYAWGGGKVGQKEQCDRCISCLDKKAVPPKEQLASCPSCQSCSLDCSHFVQLALNYGGFKFGYLTTKTMIALSAKDLARKYHLIDIGLTVKEARRGDLAVYRDHVVLIEAITAPGVATIVHATGGRDIKAPGLGIQRERKAPLASFRGPLLRILRHRGTVLGSRRLKKR